MKKSTVVFLLIIVLISCKSNNYKNYNHENLNFASVKIDTLFKEKISIRAIAIDGNKIWFAADNSKVGFFDLEKNTKTDLIVGPNNAKSEFRSLAQNKNNIFVISVANPALLYKIPKDGSPAKLVYQENHEKVFFDSMQFWNEREGIAIGDPIADNFNVIVTHDGGNSWNKIPSDKLPKLKVGEAAFAASNTNIVIKGDKTWIVSGGKKARVFYSANKGETWTTHETPIVQGKTMTGIFTADFYDGKKGFIAGGDYEFLNQNFSNKASTEDGGKTWVLRADNEAFGYASCVQYVPGGLGKALVTVGASGIFFSGDGGDSWKQLSSDTTLFTIRFIDQYNAIAAGKNKMIRIHFNQ